MLYFFIYPESAKLFPLFFNLQGHGAYGVLTLTSWPWLEGFHAGSFRQQRVIHIVGSVWIRLPVLGDLLLGLGERQELSI